MYLPAKKIPTKKRWWTMEDVLRSESVQPPTFSILPPTKNRHKSVYAPNKKMELVQRFIVRHILGWCVPMPSSTAYAKGASVRKNIELHRNSRFLYVVDLKNAYSSVNPTSLIETLDCLGSEFSKPGAARCDSSVFLRAVELYTLHPLGTSIIQPSPLASLESLEQKATGLVRGAGASPMLFNLYCERILDSPIRQLLGDLLDDEWVYSRYGDDLIISSNAPLEKDRIRRPIRRIIESAGFKINDQKTRVYDRKKGPVFLTKVGVRRSGKLFIPKKYRTSLEGLLRRACNDPNIDMRMVVGKVSYFLSITNWPFNSSEKRILKAYRLLAMKRGEQGIRVGKRHYSSLRELYRDKRRRKPK